MIKTAFVILKLWNWHKATVIVRSDLGKHWKPTVLGFVHKIEFVDDDKPKLKIKEELIDTKSSFSSIERKSEFMENCSELYNRVLKGKGTLEEMLIYKRLLVKP